MTLMTSIIVAPSVGATASTDVAIDQAWRAIDELLNRTSTSKA